MSLNKYDSNQYNAQPPGGQPYGPEEPTTGGMDNGFRKHYGFRYGQEVHPEAKHLGYVPQDRHQAGARYGFQTGEQSQAELVTPAIRASTPRPDWLDDSDNENEALSTPRPTVTPGSVTSDPVTSDPVTSDPVTSEKESAPADYTDPWATDAPPAPAEQTHPETNKSASRPAADQTGAARPTHVPPADAPAADAQSTNWSQPASAKEPAKPATITNPMQLEWFVKEDATEPWNSEPEDTETTRDAGFEPDRENEAYAVPPVTPAPAPKPASSTPGATKVPQAEPLTTTAIELDLYADRRYRAALERMQFAQWSETLLLLRAVERDYPNHPTVTALINEAELKSSVVEQWADKVRPRRLTVRQEMLIRRAIPIMLLLVLFIGAAGFYRAFVEPSRQAVAITQTTLRLLDEAQQMAFAGRFAESLAVYDSILARDPGNPLARQGRHEAESLYAVATEYTIAMRVAEAGNYARAAGLLENLLAQSPGYRDAEAQLATIRTQMSAQELFDAAEANYRLHRWLPAVQGYEALLAMNSEYQAATVRQRLQDSYVQAGLVLVEQWPAERSDLDLARDYFRKAASAGRSDAVIQAELDKLDRFFRGEQALGNADLREAINLWRSLYDETPQYLGGYLAEELYRAYLNLANRALQQNDTIYAADLYQLAVELNVKDKSEAQRGLDQIRAQAVAPTATPTEVATRAPVLAYQPPVGVPPPQPAATSTPTPEPDFGGWIAFRTNRSGGESIYVMRPDGSEQQPAPDSIHSNFQALVEAERRSPDGLKVLSVRILEGRQNPSIFLTDLGLPETVTRDFQLTNYNRDEYDAVWSPTGDLIAFVSNHPGSDEIFTMHPDGSNHRQLTFNEWQWDKHPSFSPDGSQIAFYTNRTGPRQIFLMNRDGGGQSNISRNGYEDWDPVWLKD